MLPEVLLHFLDSCFIIRVSQVCLRTREIGVYLELVVVAYVGQISVDCGANAVRKVTALGPCHARATSTGPALYPKIRMAAQT